MISVCFCVCMLLCVVFNIVSSMFARTEDTRNWFECMYAQCMLAANFKIKTKVSKHRRIDEHRVQRILKVPYKKQLKHIWKQVLSILLLECCCYYVKWKKKKSSTMRVCEWMKTLKWIRVCSDLIWCAHSINWNVSKNDTINSINTAPSSRATHSVKTTLKTRISIGTAPWKCDQSHKNQRNEKNKYARNIERAEINRTMVKCLAIYSRQFHWVIWIKIMFYCCSRLTFCMLFSYLTETQITQ